MRRRGLLWLVIAALCVGPACAEPPGRAAPTDGLDVTRDVQRPDGAAADPSPGAPEVDSDDATPNDEPEAPDSGDAGPTDPSADDDVAEIADDSDADGAGDSADDPEEDTSAPPPIDCAGRFPPRAGVELCEERADACGIVFTDRRGCLAACAAGGLACGEVWEDVDGRCAADASRPQLTCVPESGHRSDYCLCVRPEACVPACEGRRCGDDGCGGSCGTCETGARCDAGACVTPPEALCTPDHCPAFPGAEGFGSRARGGRGGDVYRVTSLADSGPGTLRDAISSARGPRTIVFATSGTIRLRSQLRVDRDYLTIAGQTAPGDGILIRGATVRITGQHIIVRHLRFRLGTDTGGEDDALWVNNARNVILDHISASWGTDETLSATRSFQYLTIQNSIIAEDLRSRHQYGSLVNCETEGCRMSLLRNAYIHQEGRTPRAASQNGRDFLLEMVNNVVYNWGTSGDWGTWATIGDNERARWNFVGNHYIAGPNTRATFSLVNHANTVLSCNGGEARVYFSGNLLDSNRDGALNSLPATWSNVRGRGCQQVNAPHEVPTWARARVLDAAAALDQVLAQAGAFPWRRDEVDTRLIADVRSWGSRGSIRTSVPGWPTLATATAPVDSDGDGMPDVWESAMGLNPNNASDGNRDRNGDGYTNLEEYLAARAQGWGGW